MQKTKEPIYLPLSPETLKWMPERGGKISEDHVFDLPSPSMMNLLIKPWAKAAGIDKRFSLHTARHTFATMMLTLGADLYDLETTRPCRCEDDTDVRQNHQPEKG